MTTILKELRISQLCSKNGRTSVCVKFFACSLLISYCGNMYHSANMSRFEAHAGFFTLLMKGIFFYPYVLSLFDKKLIS